MKTKSFVSGFILALVLSITFTAFAGTRIQKTISAWVGGITIVVDGVRMSPKDANNNAVEPILVNGTTYVPIRFISEAFGSKAKYIAETSTIYLGEKQKIESFLLRDMAPYQKTTYAKANYGTYGGWISTPYAADKRFTVIDWSNTGTISIGGKEYTSQSMVLAEGVTENVSSYVLSKNYNKMTADFGIDDASTDTLKTTGRVEIYGDGVLLKRMMKSKGEALEHFEVDLTDVRAVTIKVKGSVTINKVGSDTVYSNQVLCDLINIKMFPVDPTTTQPQ